MRHELGIGALSTLVAVGSGLVLAAVQGFWSAVLDVALVAGAIVTILTAFTAVGRTRPARALVQRLITEPLDEWFSSTVQRHTAPLAEQLERNAAGMAVLGQLIDDAEQRARYYAALHREMWPQ